MSRTVSARIPTDLHEELKKRCNLTGESINDFVKYTIKLAIGLSQQNISVTIISLSATVNDAVMSQIFQEQSDKIMQQTDYFAYLGLGVIVFGIILSLLLLRKK